MLSFLLIHFNSLFSDELLAPRRVVRQLWESSPPASAPPSSGSFSSTLSSQVHWEHLRAPLTKLSIFPYIEQNSLSLPRTKFPTLNKTLYPCQEHNYLSVPILNKTIFPLALKKTIYPCLELNYLSLLWTKSCLSVPWKKNRSLPSGIKKNIFEPIPSFRCTVCHLLYLNKNIQSYL